MDDALVLTYAEIEFLLRSQNSGQVDLRAQLELGPAGELDAAARAGVSSLLARGLCTLGGESGTDVTPTPEVLAIVAGLTTATEATRALGWVGEQLVLLHLLYGPLARLVLVPAPYGRFTVMALDPELTVADQLSRFVDSCLTDGAESAVVIQSRTAQATVGIAVARDATGAWFVSDSEGNPDSATPSTRGDVLARIGELLPAGAR
jgi:hypothetical protein